MYVHGVDIDVYLLYNPDSVERVSMDDRVCVLTESRAIATGDVQFLPNLV